MAMNKWVKRKWVRALRSGEYAQGPGWLVKSSDNGYEHCCLGVLACEMVPEFVRQRGDMYAPGVDGKTNTLPDDLAILYGLDRATQDRLVRYNDGGKDFPWIADWIEANL